MPEPRADEIRKAVAEVIGRDPGAIPDDANLIDLGVDSLGMMRLVNRWRREGLRVSFRELITDPTLGAWRRYFEYLDGESAG
jgi:aryl carrier-like protein